MNSNNFCFSDDKMSEMTILKEMPEMTMVKKMSQMMKEVPEMTIMEKMSEMAMMKEMSEMTSTMKKTDEMSTAKSENIPDWLEAFNNRAETTKKPIDWYGQSGPPQVSYLAPLVASWLQDKEPSIKYVITFFAIFVTPFPHVSTFHTYRT